VYVYFLDDLAWWTNLLMQAIIGSEVCSVMESVVAFCEKGQW